MRQWSAEGNLPTLCGRMQQDVADGQLRIIILKLKKKTPFTGRFFICCSRHQ